MTTPRISRAQWGARPPEGPPTRVPSTDGTALHWVGPGTWGAAGSIGRHSLCAGKVRGIQRSHQAGEWRDIAYNEVCCPHGYRFEGRGHNVQTGANGSSAGNRSHYAILALVGVGDAVTTQLLEALEDAFDDYRRHAAAGDDTTTHRSILRRETGRTTECPGDRLAALEAAGRFSPRPPAPPAPTPPPDPTPAANKRRTAMLVKVKGSDPVWVSDGITRRHLPNSTALADYRAALKAAGAPASALEPFEVPSEARALAAFGKVIP